jgi:myo-inositol 2-dehydrogenase / D-chiro-inositol 1-dehydrogenase
MVTATRNGRAGAHGGSPAGKPLRIGVIGVGRIGRLHAELIAGPVRGATLAAVHDVRSETASSLAAALGVPAAVSAEELIASPDVDAVAVCSSTDTHADLIVAATSAGKATFCEKPVSLDLEEVDRALTAVTRTGTPFQIGFNRRFDPAHQAVREAVARGEVGEPHLVRISSRDPAPPPLDYVRVSGGIFLDMTIHDFDMARYLTGSEVTDVYARGTRRIEPAYADTGDVDTALVVLNHENGCITAIDNSRRAAYGFDQRVEVFGSRGMAASENPLSHSGLVRTEEGTRMPTLPYFFLDRYVPSYVGEWEAFVGAVRAGKAPPVGPTDARAPLVIGLAAWRSLREGRPVAVKEVEP